MARIEGMEIDIHGKAVQVLALGAVAEVAYLVTSVQSAVLAARVVRVISTTDCYIEVGTNPTAAAATSTLLPAMVAEYIKIDDDDKIAAIRKTADGTLNITAIK